MLLYSYKTEIKRLEYKRLLLKLEYVKTQNQIIKKDLEKISHHIKWLKENKNKRPYAIII